MKQSHGWYWPDHEKHLITWIGTAYPPVKLNGRVSYQGKKQVAAMLHCTKFQNAVDIGAHIGLWSFNLAAKFDRVFAFEPVAAHRECFAKNVEADNVELFPVALGATEGTVSIDTTVGSSGDSKIGKGKGDIPLRTLDSFNLPNVDFMKMDCEGFEENVILGAGETIRKWKPVIIVEQKREMASRFGLQPLGAVKLLQKMGYTLAQEISGDYIMVHK